MIAGLAVYQSTHDADGVVILTSWRCWCLFAVIHVIQGELGMFCVKCGTEVKIEGARFCSSCGAELPRIELEQTVVSSSCQHCHVECVETREIFSLFGKDMMVYQAVLDGVAERTVVAKSKEFAVTGFSFNGPDPKNKYHRTPFEKMIESMQGRGWVEDGSYGKDWYCLKLKRVLEE